MDTLSIEARAETVVYARLSNPMRALSPLELATHWFQQDVVVTLDRPERHDPPLALLNRIRGAWGDALKRGASAPAIAGFPCSFSPPCAFDVFFREQMRIGGHGLPKPYVMALTPRRNTLVVRLSVFGFACEWIETARDRLVEALSSHVRWTGDAPASPARLRSSTVETTSGLPVPPPPRSVTLEFLSPLDATGADLEEAPSTVVARIARRADGLARWMDCDIDISWEKTALAWSDARYEFDELEFGTAVRGSRRQRKAYENPVAMPRLTVAGDIGPFWPLLVIGEKCHVGRGAVAGQGRYRLLGEP